MPTQTASDLRAPAMHELAALLAGDPLRVAGLGRDLAVQAHRRLEHDMRASGARVLAERLVQQPGGVRDLAVHDLDVDPLVAQDAEPAAGGLVGGVVGRDHDSLDAGVHDRVGAGRRAAVMAAGLERHVHGRADRIGHARAERRDLGVIAPVGGVVALAEHLVVARDHRAHERVRARVAATELCELDGPLQVTQFAVGQECSAAPPCAGSGPIPTGPLVPCYARQPLAHDSTVGPAVSNGRRRLCSLRLRSVRITAAVSPARSGRGPAAPAGARSGRPAAGT